MYRLMPFSRRALRAAAALAAITPSLAAAQQQRCAGGETTLRVGDARLAGFTPSAVDTVDMWMERDTEIRPLGVYTQHVERIQHDGGPAFLVVQRTEMPGRTMLDSVTVRAGSFAPLRHVAATPVHTADVRFAAGRVAGTVADSGNARAVDAVVSGGALDYSVASMALQAVPLCEGTVVKIETYDVARGPVLTTARVVGAETVTLRGRAWGVWAVDYEFGAGTSRLYVDRATGRQVGWMTSLPGGRAMKGALRVSGGGGS